MTAGLCDGIHSMEPALIYLLQTTISRHFHFPPAGVASPPQILSTAHSVAVSVLIRCSTGKKYSFSRTIACRDPANIGLKRLLTCVSAYLCVFQVRCGTVLRKMCLAKTRPVVYT